MIIFITIILILFVSTLGAYNSVFQETTLRLGRKLSINNPTLPTGLQDAITPRSQNLRNLLFFILLLGLFIYSLIYFNWYLVILMPIFALFILTPLIKIFLPRTNSQFYIMKIRSDLSKRLKKYEARNDTARALAVKYILMKLEFECWGREITSPREWQIDNWVSFDRERKIMFVNELRKTAFKKDIDILTTLNKPSEFYVDEIDSLIVKAKNKNFELKTFKKWGLVAVIICNELAKELSNHDSIEYEKILPDLKNKLGDIKECFEEILKINA